MTFEETSQIMYVLETAYPQFYNGKSAPNRDRALALWASMFADDDARLVSAAVEAIITGSESHFPPSIGEVKEKMRVLSSPREMTELEAWGYVSRAVCNGLYGSKEEFEKLPPLVQRLVGSPNQLKEWAQLDREDLQTVVASNFQRSFRMRAQSEREYLKLPQSVRDFVGQIAGRMTMEALPEGVDDG